MTKTVLEGAKMSTVDVSPVEQGDNVSCTLEAY